MFNIINRVKRLFNKLPNQLATEIIVAEPKITEPSKQSRLDSILQKELITSANPLPQNFQNSSSKAREIHLNILRQMAASPESKYVNELNNFINQ